MLNKQIKDKDLEIETIRKANESFSKMYEDYSKRIEALDYMSAKKFQKYKQYRNLQKVKIKYDSLLDELKKLIDILRGKQDSKYNAAGGTIDAIISGEYGHSYNRFVLFTGYYSDTISVHGAYPTADQAFKAYNKQHKNKSLYYGKIYDTYNDEVIKEFKKPYRPPIDKNIIYTNGRNN